MASFLPEFAQHWLVAPTASSDDVHPLHPGAAEVADGQDDALEALAERVCAARSIF